MLTAHRIALPLPELLFGHVRHVTQHLCHISDEDDCSLLTSSCSYFQQRRMCLWWCRFQRSAKWNTISLISLANNSVLAGFWYCCAWDHVTNSDKCTTIGEPSLITLISVYVKGTIWSHSLKQFSQIERQQRYDESADGDVMESFNYFFQFILF